ncbi:type I-E CRISPR-associated endonuclease Cas1e [Actinopolyspora mortivallis]|uniref:CRISPR-associated endonuclease Cas1 n=1 Tax=Actinopolyspora mortivallis TaxID=33906 RepID=A0A2T0H089_ACTMO|nr:type I-E CRISPR-associated endonuclease Cas1e [Actinopolyspora mortivallis]PRW64775.1 type I-E CRISPR-associated endonuclease Cas1 [Actinopolyspora mortivallis]
MNTTLSDPRRLLTQPTVAMLPKVADSLSFLYLEHVRVVQDDTGVCAHIEHPDTGPTRIALPVAALSCVLLGPGTSATQAAMATCARHNTSVLWTGSGGVRMYSGSHSANLTTEWLECQVRAWADENARLAVAARMYAHRFGTTVPEGTSLHRLRGLEGQRMKTLYHSLAEQHKLRGFRRDYDPHNWSDQNPINQALSAANTALYGTVHSAILALGCSPALGFIHSGKQHSFVYDIADLYKATHTIPLAFALNNSTNPEREARVRLRNNLRLYRLLPQIVTDIQQLLDPTVEPNNDDNDPEETELVHLWDPDLGAIDAGINHADKLE